jgi:hypothetical protein
LLLGCADDEAPFGPCDGKPCPSQCRALSAEGSCDVQDSACQELIFTAVGCVRGEQGDLPPVRLISEEEQRAEELLNMAPRIDAGTEADASSDGAGPRQITIPPDSHERGLALFGLGGERDPETSSARLLGYYRGARAGVSLIDHGGKYDDEAPLQRVLAHEFVHAYQDQQRSLYDPLAGFGASADGSLVNTCMVEGEARLYDVLTWRLLSDVPLDEAFLHDIFTRDVERARQRVATEGSPEQDLPNVCYGLGASYLLREWLEGGARAVRARLDAPPATSVQWMRATSPRNDERWETSDRRLGCRAVSAPADYLRLGANSLGALRLFALLSVALAGDGEPPIQQSWDRALDWQRDSFESFVGPDSEIAASWRIVLTDEKLTGQLARELTDALPHVLVSQQGAEIELRAAEDPALLEAWSSHECSES